MCGDPYSRSPTVDSGDLIAIIHPASLSTSRPVHYSTPFLGGRLHLSNHQSGFTTSTFSCREDSISSASAFTSTTESDSGSEVYVESAMPELLKVRIHRFGQPLSPWGKRSEDANPVMHAFLVHGGWCDASSSSAGVRLNLGVGGDGVVGRTVSIVDARDGNGEERVLGEGIIGWS